MAAPATDKRIWVVKSDVLDLLARIPDSSVEVVCTDPDYGVPVPQDGKLTRDPEWVADSTEDATYLDWFDRWFREVARVLVPGGACVCWCNQEMTTIGIMKRYLTYRRTLYWVKSNAWPNSPTFYSAVETAVWLSKGKGPYRWNKGVADRSPAWILAPTVTQNDRRGHPTSKSVEVIRWVLERLSQPDDLILDPFCGSGSIGEAAVGLGRRYLGGDIDPHWVTVTRERLGL